MFTGYVLDELLNEFYLFNKVALPPFQENLLSAVIY